LLLVNPKLAVGMMLIQVKHSCTLFQAGITIDIAVEKKTAAPIGGRRRFEL
jgi:hypothetical protein